MYDHYKGKEKKWYTTVMHRMKRPITFKGTNFSFARVDGEIYVSIGGKFVKNPDPKLLDKIRDIYNRELIEEVMSK